MAVREGFEPSIRCRIHTFQACSFSHSDTSPKSDCLPYFPKPCCKVASGALRCARCSGHPALRPFGAILRMSKFVPDKFVSHSDNSPNITIVLFPFNTSYLASRLLVVPGSSATAPASPGGAYFWCSTFCIHAVGAVLQMF